MSEIPVEEAVLLGIIARMHEKIPENMKKELLQKLHDTDARQIAEVLLGTPSDVVSDNNKKALEFFRGWAKPRVAAT